MPNLSTSAPQQTFVVAELVALWRDEQRLRQTSGKPLNEPIVLYDRHAWQQVQAEAISHVPAIHVEPTEQLVPVAALTESIEPTLQTDGVTQLSLPAAPVVPTASLHDVTLPQLTLPELTPPKLPKLELPQTWIDRSLQFGSQFAYAATIATIVFFFGPVLILESQSWSRKLSAHIGNQLIMAEQTPTASAQPTPEPTPIVTSQEDVFSLSIPSLNIASAVVPNVDTHNAAAYESALKEGIAHAAGTGLPDQLDQNKTIYLFAHSTDNTWNIARYNAQFYALKDIEEGALITVRFWGEDHTYRVTSKDIVAADDITALTPQTEKEQLILQTCYPPGTAWKRLLVTAEPVL